MKRLFAIALALCSLFALTIPVYAADGLPSASNTVTNETEYIYLSDGSVIVSTLVVEDVATSDAQTRAISYGKKGSRTVSCYDDEEETELEWSFTFTAYFWVNEGIHCRESLYIYRIRNIRFEFHGVQVIFRSEIRRIYLFVQIPQVQKAVGHFRSIVFR